MSKQSAVKQTPDIWLWEQEESGTADCGCHLDSEYRGRVGSGNNGSPAFFFCPLHKAASNLLSALKLAHRRWGILHNLVSALVEDGKLSEGHLEAIALALKGGVEADAAADRALKAATPVKPEEPGWFA